jgi:hypothetical protein
VPRVGLDPQSRACPSGQRRRKRLGVLATDHQLCMGEGSWEPVRGADERGAALEVDEPRLRAAEECVVRGQERGSAAARTWRGAAVAHFAAATLACRVAGPFLAQLAAVLAFALCRLPHAEPACAPGRCRSPRARRAVHAFPPHGPWSPRGRRRSRPSAQRSPGRRALSPQHERLPPATRQRVPPATPMRGPADHRRGVVVAVGGIRRVVRVIRVRTVLKFTSWG